MSRVLCPTSALLPLSSTLLPAALQQGMLHCPQQASHRSVLNFYVGRGEDNIFADGCNKVLTIGRVQRAALSHLYCVQRSWQQRPQSRAVSPLQELDDRPAHDAAADDDGMMLMHLCMIAGAG